MQQRDDSYEGAKKVSTLLYVMFRRHASPFGWSKCWHNLSKMTLSHVLIFQNGLGSNCGSACLFSLVGTYFASTYMQAKKTQFILVQCSMWARPSQSLLKWSSNLWGEGFLAESKPFCIAAKRAAMTIVPNATETFTPHYTQWSLNF